MTLGRAAAVGPSPEPGYSPEAGRLMRLASQASVAVACLLILAKAAAWFATDSLAMLASLADSALDLLASLGNLVAVRAALIPPDEDHRFGHGKAESVAGLIQGAFVAGSALFILFEAVRRLLRPEAVQHEFVGVAVSLLAIAVTVALVAFQRQVVARTGSLAVSADSLHYAGDLFMNAAIIAGLLAQAWFGWAEADALIGLGVATLLLWGARGILRQAIDELMDRELPEGRRQAILDAARSVPGVEGLHDLRTRGAGPVTFVQLHVEIDGALPLDAAHVIADKVEAAVCTALPGAEAILHLDPVRRGQDGGAS